MGYLLNFRGVAFGLLGVLAMAGGAEQAAYAASELAATSAAPRAMPDFPVIASDDENIRQLILKYQGYAQIMSPSSARNVVALIRKEIPDDLAYWQKQAARSKPRFSPPDDPKQARKYARRYKSHVLPVYVKQKATADSNVRWLSATLPQWCREVEAASLAAAAAR